MFLVKAEFQVHKVVRKGTGRGTTRVWAAASRGAVTAAHWPGSPLRAGARAQLRAPARTERLGHSAECLQGTASVRGEAFLSFRYETATRGAQTQAAGLLDSPAIRSRRPGTRPTLGWTGGLAQAWAGLEGLASAPHISALSCGAP